MATFPTAEELQRPIPRIDGSVPTYQPAMTGEAGPRATYQAGQVIQSLGQDVGDFAQRLDAADAQDALNKFRQKRQELTYDPEKGFLRLKGRAAIDKINGKSVMDTTVSALDAESEAIAKNLSPRAAAAYRARAINETLSFKADLVKHQMHETEKFEGAVYVDAQAMNLNRASLSAQDDRALEIISDQAGKLARQRAETLGMPGDAAAQAAQSDVLKAAVVTRIAKGDPSAIGFFEKHKDKFDAKDRVGLEQSIKEMSIGVQAQSSFANLGSGPGREKFLATITPHAMAVSKETGLDPRLVIAQSALETGWGKGAPGNNYFGVKSHGRPGGQMLDTKEAAPNGELVPARESFRTYANPGESAADYAAFLKSNSRYAPVLAAKGLDAQIEAMGKSGYATDKDYTTKLRQIAQSLPDPNAGGQVAQGDAVAKPGTPGPIATPSPRTITTSTGDVILADYDPATGSMRVSVPNPEVKSEDGIVNKRDMKIQAQQIYIDKLEANTRENGNNPQVHAKVKGMIEAEYAANKAKVQLYADQTWNAVQEYVAKGGPNGGPAVTMPPVEILSKLTPEQQVSVEKLITHNIEGKKVKTDQNVWYNIHQKLTSANANERETWAGIPLFQFKEFLSDADFQELAKLQASVRKGEGRELTEAQTVTGLLNSTLLTMGIDPTPKPGSGDATKSATFHRAFQEELTTFEREKGKKADPLDRQKIVDGLVKKVATEGWLFNGSQSVAFLTAKDVPATDRLQIISEIRRQGGVPTEERILQVYRHNLVNQPTQTEIPRPLEPPMLGLPGANRPVQAPPRVIDNPTQDESRSVRDRYQDAMSIPSRDLATMGVSALRRALGLE